MASSKVTKLLFLGDISTRYGRQIVRDVLPSIKKKDGVDIVVANCENAAGGRGVTREIVNELQACGIDYFTTGEHVWDVARFRNDLVDENVPLLRPYNYEGMGEIPGKGWTVLDMGANGQIIIINLIGQVFMRDHVRSPFWAFDELYRKLEEDLGQEFLQKTPIIIDLHAETTAEKIAFAWYVKDKVAAVLGTHTHVGTVDTRLLNRENGEGACAFVTDVGMCGPKDASLWVAFDSIIHNFKYPYKKSFKVEKQGGRIFNSVLVEIQKNSSRKITRIDKIAER